MGALDGILVVAIEQAVAAPLCTVRLADAGARVIKVERASGETARNYDSAVKGTSAYFAWLNRGKESIVLDLKTPPDMALLRRMLAKADVLVQNLAPGALDRMGLTEEVRAAEFPQLIMLSITGYGRDTDYADMKAYDMLVQAESGLCAVTGTPDDPAKVGVSVADIATGTNAHAAILEALIARGATGRGQSIEIAMFDSLADWMTVPLLHFQHQGTETARFGMSHAAIYPYGPMPCSDGTVIIAVQTADEWHRLCTDVAGLPDIAADPAFATNTQRVAQRDAVDAMLKPAIAKLTVAEAMARCTKARIAFGRYRTVADASDHPAMRHMTVALPDGTPIALPQPAGRPKDARVRKLPALGEQTDAIRAEFC